MRILIILLYIFISNVSWSQYSPLQTQYVFNGVALNPAMTGCEQTMSIVGTFRAQWVGFPGAPKTEVITVHAPIKATKSSIGLQMYGDQIGVSRNLGIYGLYAYRLQFKNKSNLSLGISGGVNMIRANYDELTVDSQNDALIRGATALSTLPNFSFGAHYFTKKYFVNFSVPMFLLHDYDGTKFQVKNDFKNYNFLFGGGYDFEINKGLHLKPSVLLKYRVNNRLQADINLKADINDILGTGIQYRTEEAIIVFFEVKLNKQFSTMYSFGLPLNSLLKYTYGSHEFSVKYNFMYKTKSVSPRYLGW